MKRLTLAIAISILLEISMFAQAAAPFASVVATVPPAIGQPGVTLAWDITNKLIIVTFQVSNAAGTISTLTTVSYNPRLLEGANPAGSVLQFAGVTAMLKHNLPADPLQYQIGNVSGVLTSCSIVTPLPTGQTACPTIPF